MADLIALLYLAVVDDDPAASWPVAFPRPFEAGAATGLEIDRLRGQVMQAALDLIPYPAFVTDGHARVRYANRAGGMGPAPIERGLLPLCDGRDVPLLRRAIADASKGGQGSTNLAQNSVITVGQLPVSFGPLTDVRGLVLVVVQPLAEDRDVLSQRCVRALSLTSAEADIVAGIAAGETPTEVATRRGVRVATVRTLIRRALDKTGCAGLRELTGLVLRLPPWIS